MAAGDRTGPAGAAKREGAAEQCLAEHEEPLLTLCWLGTLPPSSSRPRGRGSVRGDASCGYQPCRGAPSAVAASQCWGHARAPPAHGSEPQQTVLGAHAPPAPFIWGPPALAHHQAGLWAKWAALWLPLLSGHPRGSQARGRPAGCGAGGRMASLRCVAERCGWSTPRPRRCPPHTTAAVPVMYSSQGAPVQLQYHYWRLLHH